MSEKPTLNRHSAYGPGVRIKRLLRNIPCHVIFNLRLAINIFKLARKIAKSDYLLRRVCPSVSIGQLGCHWTYFNEILYCDYFFQNISRNSNLINCDKNNGHLI